MCGIFGFLTRRAEEATRIDLAAATRALAHRGPDDEGTFSGNAGGVYCGLAHTRLAIVDLSPGGHQPMRSADGRYVIVYNGEIYNHREVREELEEDGPPLRTSSDTEVIIEAYRKWGPAALGRLRGMFALAIWDTRLGHLFLARDRLGIKPLYFTTSSLSGIAFASEIRTLLATGMAAPKLSMAGVAGYLHWGSVPEPLTILDAVETLPPGCYLTYQDGVPTIVRYWKPSLAATTARTFDEAVEQVRPLLREAVSLRLVADVPVGIFLSGGIDSSAITALAASTSSQPLHTFNVAFEESAMNEGQYAALVASRFGCIHHEVLLKQDRLRDELDDALAALDQPSADGTNTFFVAKAVRESGISVVLSGLGGDEVFAGYQNFRKFGKALRVSGLLPSSTAGFLESLATLPLIPPTNRTEKLAALLTGRGDTFGTYAALRCMFTPSQVRRLLTSSPVTSPSGGSSAAQGLDAALEAERIADPINLYSALELTNYVRDTLLRDADVMSMAHALEVRVPLLDHRLVEHVLTIPGHLKLADHVNKPLLVASSPTLPDKIVNRAKMGFTLPWESWLRGSLRPRMEHLLGSTSIERLGVLKSGEVDALWRSFVSGDKRVTFSRVWCVAALAAWCERNGVAS